MKKPRIDQGDDLRVVRHIPEAAVLRLPSMDPSELLELLTFWRRMEAQTRLMRDTTSLPRAAVTLPDEFDEIVARLFSAVEAQARAGMESGAREIAVEVPATEGLRRLAAWAGGRRDLLEGLVRAGMIGAEWQRQLELMSAIWDGVLEQLG